MIPDQSIDAADVLTYVGPLGIPYWPASADGRRRICPVIGCETTTAERARVERDAHWHDHVAAARVAAESAPLTVADLEVGDIVTAMGTKTFTHPLTVASVRRSGDVAITVYLAGGAFWPMAMATARITTVTAERP